MDHPHVSRSTYYKVYGLLLALLGSTIGAAYLHIGYFNLPLAMAIAILKAVLVILFFMHVRFSSRWVWVFSAMGFIWLAYLLIGTFGDYLTRGGG